MAVYFERAMEQTRSLAERSGNTEVLADMDRRSGEMHSFQQTIRAHLAEGSSLNDVALGRITRLEEARNVLSLPIPKRPYPKSADSVQTPMVPKLAAWVLTASFGGQVANLEQRLPANVMQHRSRVLELLVRSIALCNESVSAVVSRYNSTNPDVPFESLVTDEESYMATISPDRSRVLARVGVRVRGKAPPVWDDACVTARI